MKIYYDNLETLNLKGVYLIRNLDNNLLKIGKCNNLKRRFTEIQKSFNFVGQDHNLKIECFIEFNENSQLERYLHNKFHEFRFKNEWFKINDIKVIIKELDNFKYNIIEHKKSIKDSNKKEPVNKISNSYIYYLILDYNFKDSKIIYRTKNLLENPFLKLDSNISKMCGYYSFIMGYEKEDVKDSKEMADKYIINNFEILKYFDEFKTDCIIIKKDKPLNYYEEVKKYLYTKIIDSISENKKELEEIYKETTNSKIDDIVKIVKLNDLLRFVNLYMKNEEISIYEIESLIY